MKKICITCNTEYDVREDRGNYCSRKCYLKNITVPKMSCKKCGIIFQPKMRITKYCSRKCYAEATTSIGNLFYGKHHTIATKKIMSKHKLGKKLSLEHRDKLSEAHKWVTGENNPFYGRKHSDETKALWKQYRPKPNTPMNSNTKPERTIKKYLESKGLIKGKDFYQNYWINDIKNIYRADFIIPKTRTVIECDGDHWHNYPIGNDIDHIRTKELQETGYKVIRFWESQIKKRFNEIQNILNPIIVEVGA
jgi:very-short-patch-repair endonuclease